jgi:hypothetical protein
MGAEHRLPITGSFNGKSDAFLSMDVSVQVKED